MGNKKIMKLYFAGDFIPIPSVTIDSELEKVIKGADYSFVNLETPLTNSKSPIKKTGNNFKTSPELVNKIKKFGFSGVTLANNHIRDFGDEGVMDTIEALENQKLLHLGAGKNIHSASKPLRLEKNGLKVSIINVGEKEFNIASESKAGANPYDTIGAFYKIKEEKKVSDKVIVVYHGGVEYIKYPAPYIVKEFKFLIDVGADAVISHHTHRYSGAIYYNERPIIFGLGNFFSTSSVKNHPVEWFRGIMFNLNFSEHEINTEMILIEFDDQVNEVVLVKGDNKKEIISDIEEINMVIQSNNVLQKKWINFITQESQKIISLLGSKSKLEFNIKKRLPQKFVSISEYRLIRLLNLIRCNSHVEKLKDILEKKYQELN